MRAPHADLPEKSDAALFSARTVLRECFWGDYRLSEQDILEKIRLGEPGFDVFLFSKILENSRHPSRHLKTLFPPDVLNRLLQRHLRANPRNKRVRLVAANLTGDYDLVPELEWKR